MILPDVSCRAQRAWQVCQVHQGSGPASGVVGSAELEAEPPADDVDRAPVKGMLRAKDVLKNKQKKKFFSRQNRNRS